MRSNTAGLPTAGCISSWRCWGRRRLTIRACCGSRSQDQGVGFDPSKLVQPRVENNLTSMRKRGWGLKIIEGLMDEVNVLSGEGGTSVVMSKAR